MQDGRPDRFETPPQPDPVRVASCSLDVEGLDCASCAAVVEQALRAVDGVVEVRADMLAERVTVTYDAHRVEHERLVGAVRRSGYVAHAPETRAGALVFEVEGMCCAMEARQLERGLQGLDGVGAVTVDLVSRRLTVQGSTPTALVEDAVARLGMRARPLGEAAPGSSGWRRHGRLALVLLAGALWLASFAADHLLGRREVAAVLALGAMVAGGWYVLPRGFRAIRSRSLDMNALMSIAAVGALLIGEFGEAASVLTLFALAQLLEARSMDRARDAVRALMSLAPVTASVIRNGAEQRVPAESVRVGETVIVRPGERIPVDGEVREGGSSVNQAPITGESVPVDKTPGAEVFAGTLNGEGVLEVRSTRPAHDTTLARIIQSVEGAQASRAPSQSFVERFARVYTPLVVGAAIAIALLPPLLGLGGWGEWLSRALVLLVVSCPCALVISTPVTIVSALAGAARAGILIKGGLHLENAGRARVVALDKTGTLTLGEPAVVEVLPLDGTPTADLLALAASAEARSEHPLARAIVRYAEERGIGLGKVVELEAIPGKGLRARVGEERVVIGTERLFREQGGLTAAASELLRRHEEQGRTAVLVGAERSGALRPLGVIAIADQVRPEAAAALRELHRSGVQRVVMLTGDNPGTARAVAAQLGARGVDELHAELLPQDKVDKIEELRRRYGRVAFVGDGVNDAPALAAADVGIAMGGVGTDVALETADIVLMSDDLPRLATTIGMARKAEGIIRFNIGLSLATKAVFMALAITGWATLWMAVAADMGTSLIVTLNGLRALRE